MNREGRAELAGPDEDRSEAPAAAAIDRAVHALAARFTLGISPAALAAGWSDWAFHATGRDHPSLGDAPGRYVLQR